MEPASPSAGVNAAVAEQRWEAVPPGGWRVRERFQGWHFRLEPVAGGSRMVMPLHGGEPAAWAVPGLWHDRQAAGG